MNMNTSVQNSNQSNSGWKWRLVVSAILVIGDYITYGAYNSVRPAIDGALAAQQVNGGTGTLLVTSFLLNAMHILAFFTAAIIPLLWLTWILRVTSKDATRNKMGQSYPRLPHVGLMLLGGVALMTGCGPARFEKFTEIGPNETAFVIPLTGDSIGNQVKFNSIEYLNSKKVSAKRIPVPLVSKSTGRMYWDYEWMDTIRIIKVNRSLVSEEWTKDKGVPVVTKDGIQLSLGVAITVFIEEDDAPTYLYYHGEQLLHTVANVNIRNFCISELTREYGTLDLTDAKTKGPEIFARLLTDARTYFKSKGISVQQLGNAEGYVFKNETIQESINRRFTAEQDIATATQEKLAQDQRNLKLLATAETSAAAAKKIYEAKEATTLQNQLDIATMRAKAAMAMAEKWNGQMPANILPSDSPILLNMGTSAVNAPK